MKISQEFAQENYFSKANLLLLRNLFVIFVCFVVKQVLEKL